jgi:hypothetical protein
MDVKLCSDTLHAHPGKIPQQLSKRENEAQYGCEENICMDKILCAKL